MTAIAETSVHFVAAVVAELGRRFEFFAALRAFRFCGGHFASALGAEFCAGVDHGAAGGALLPGDGFSAAVAAELAADFPAAFRAGSGGFAFEVETLGHVDVVQLLVDLVDGFLSLSDCELLLDVGGTSVAQALDVVPTVLGAY